MPIFLARLSSQGQSLQVCILYLFVHDLDLLRKIETLWIECFVISLAAFANCSLYGVE